MPTDAGPLCVASQRAPVAAGAEVLRVAICTAGELFGGVERHVLGLIEGLRPLGVDVALALFHDRELARAARALGVAPLVLPASNRSTLRASRLLAAWLAARCIDVVHAHGYKATLACALARRRHRFALVKTEHGLPELDGGSTAARLRTRAYHALDRAAARSSGATVCYVTEELRAHYARSHRGLERHVVENGVAPPASLPRPAALDGRAFHAAIVGRVDEVKGHRDAILALATGDALGDVLLHVVGTGPGELALRALAQQRGVESQVRFHGFRADAVAFIAHADALLIPSLHEGLPYVLIEAMTLGTPIVATRVGGLAEVLEDGATALLVPPRDPGALAGAIARLRADRSAAARRAEAARRLARARFSLDAMARRYAGLYAGARRRVR